jgi:hypothetical protein
MLALLHAHVEEFTKQNGFLLRPIPLLIVSSVTVALQQ